VDEILEQIGLVSNFNLQSMKPIQFKEFLEGILQHLRDRYFTMVPISKSCDNQKKGTAL